MFISTSQAWGMLGAFHDSLRRFAIIAVEPDCSRRLLAGAAAVSMGRLSPHERF